MKVSLLQIRQPEEVIRSNIKFASGKFEEMVIKKRTTILYLNEYNQDPRLVPRYFPAIKITKE